MVRLFRAAMVVLLAVAGSFAFFSAPANAAVLDVACTSPSSANTTTFNPPLSLVLAPTTLTYRTDYRPCRSVTPNLTYGKVFTTTNLLDQCQMVLATFTITYTITWNTGHTSTIQATRTASISGSTLTVDHVGTVIAGLYTGSTAVEQQVGSAVALQNCLAGVSRLKELTSKVTLKIYH